MVGTFAGGWPTDRFGARRVLVVATALRAVALAAIPLALMTGTTGLFWIMAWYTVDAFVRGFVDASAHTLPLEIAEHSSEMLDWINSRYEFMFELGAASGPLLLAMLIHSPTETRLHVAIPFGFLLSSFAYFMIPRYSRQETKSQSVRSNGTWSGLRTVFANRTLLIACTGLMLFHVYPLRKLIAAFFAKGFTNHPGGAGFVGTAFALGGLAGASLYSRVPRTLSWIFAGAGGIAVLAVGWIPGQLTVMSGSAFLFALTNTGARLRLTRIRQKLTPLNAAGGVTAASEFAANFASVILKALVGVAFTISHDATVAFAILAAGLTVLAIGQIAIGRYLSASQATLEINAEN